MNLVFIDENRKKICYDLTPLADRFYMIEDSLYLKHSTEDDLSESVFIPGDYEENSDKAANENIPILGGGYDLKINCEDASDNQFDELRDFMKRYGRDVYEGDGDHIRIETLDEIRIGDVRGGDWVEITNPTLTRTTYAAVNTGTVPITGTVSTTLAGWRI